MVVVVVVVVVVLFCLFCFVIALQYNKISVDNHAEVLFWSGCFTRHKRLRQKKLVFI